MRRSFRALALTAALALTLAACGGDDVDDTTDDTTDETTDDAAEDDAAEDDATEGSAGALGTARGGSGARA
jgi:uncharacterized low-complexity protein